MSVTPSGGWMPAVIAGKTGIGMSQRMQSFVLDPAENPFNVIAPGKRPRATLTPSLALKDGKPMLAFAVQGGDTQDQNLLQFFLNVVEFGMNVQEAAEAREHHQLPDARLVRRARVVPRPPDADELDPGLGAQRAARARATSSSSRRPTPARSPRSTSIASTARCGAPPRITARTMASPGEW